MKDPDVLEQNVSSLLETGGEPPRISDVARARIRGALVDKFAAAPAQAARTRLRTPILAAGLGVIAAAAVALVVLRFVGKHDEGTPIAGDTLADGSTYTAAPGAHVAVLGTRHVRVDGAVLLDVAPGKGTFTVDTVRGRIEVLGTRFLVDGEPDRTTAAVVRGEVKLASDRGEVLLHAGEQGIAEAGRAPVRGPAPRLSQLVSWSREARRGDDQATPVHHGTLFARDPGLRTHAPWGNEYPLPIAKLGIDVVVENRVARVALDQTFHNEAAQELEGVYRFAIPPDAALQRLAMYVDGHLEESAVVERMRARRIYEELVYRRVDPALLEWAGNGRLSLRVYPIPALQDKRLMLAYTQSLPKLYDDWTLTIPLPEVDRPVGELDATVRVAGCAKCELTSTSHAITVEQRGEDAVVHYHRAGEKTGDSFVLHVRDARRATTVAMQTDGGDHYMMVRAPVELDHAARAYRPRTWVILDDVSASRNKLELRAQQALVDAFLRELDENDRVAVVAFDVEARQKLAPTRVLDVDLGAVHRALESEGGVGATDFGVGLDAALHALGTTPADDATIVYLGDGVITAGARELDVLRTKLVGKAHFVGVGVGDGPDTQSLGALAAVTGGYATTIDLSDDVAWRAFDLVAALHTARVTGVTARVVDASGALVPATTYLASPQLADGEEVELVAKLAGTGTPAAVELEGTSDGAAWHRHVALDGPRQDRAGYLPRLWASRHIAARLLAKHEPVVLPPCRTGGCPTEAQAREQRDEAIRQEVVALGKRYFLLSRHTSLLVLENDAMYAQYQVAKGAGDTWAPYAMPATIAVAPPTGRVPAPQPVLAADSELVRAPLQVFYDSGQFQYRAMDADRALAGPMGGGGGGRGDETGGGRAGIGDMVAGPVVTVPIAAGRVGTLGHGAGYGAGYGDTGIEEQTTRDGHMRFAAGEQGVLGQLAIDQTEGRLQTVLRGAVITGPSSGAFVLQRYLSPSDTAFDDITGFVPALFRDDADAWRARLGAGASGQTIDAAARDLLERARRQLPAGIYRWGERELAIDNARRVGWRTTTEAGLRETASYDGAAFVRRYAELGLDATRVVGDDDVALALAYLPVWIAEPAHYARWFDVTARGAHEVVLARGKRVAYVLSFDDRDRLVAVRDAAGGELVAVTWGANGPTAARVMGAPIAVGFSAEAVGDAVTWAHQDAPPGVVVELPTRTVAFWQDRAARLTAGSAEWRHVQRQLLASFAALQDRGSLFNTYDLLRTHGGAERGDLVLASSGLATATTDAQLASVLAPFSGEPLARYLAAGRAYGKAPRPERIAPQVHDGLVGALWSLRGVVAEVAADHGKVAADALVAMGERAPELRLIAAAALARSSAKPEDVVHGWSSLASGRYANVARAELALAFTTRGDYDAAARSVAELVDHLDLNAPPGALTNPMYAFQASRRGVAGWQLVWARWRERVLAGTSFAHVMALVPMATDRPGDLLALLARANELAGDDTRRATDVVRAAVAVGQAGWAAPIVKRLVAQSPSRELEQLAAQLALGTGDLAGALAALEAAQDAGGDEPVPVETARAELSEIIELARRLAMASSGAERQRAVARALLWSDRWRAIDPGNAQIDETVGGLLLAVGDRAGAWRQLSSLIERDPWSGQGYMTVAEAFEHEGNVPEALAFWHQAVIIDQTNPTPRLREAQALIALGRTAEGDAELREIASRPWHDAWSGVVYQATQMLERGPH